MAWNGWNGPASQSLSRLGMVLSPKAGKHDAQVNFTSIGTVTKKRNATEAEMLEDDLRLLRDKVRGEIIDEKAEMRADKKHRRDNKNTLARRVSHALHSKGTAALAATAPSFKPFQESEKGGIVRRLSQSLQLPGSGTSAPFSARALDRAGNAALALLAHRFEYYRGPSGDCIERSGLRQLCLDALGDEVTPERLQALFSEADTQHDGRVTYDEFVSMFSLTQRDLADVCLDLREVLKTGKVSSKNLFAELCESRAPSHLSPLRVGREIEARLERQLLPGEMRRCCELMGPGLDRFKFFLRAEPAVWLQDALADRPVTELELTLGKGGERVPAGHIVKVHGHREVVGKQPKEEAADSEEEARSGAPRPRMIGRMAGHQVWATRSAEPQRRTLTNADDSSSGESGDESETKSDSDSVSVSSSLPESEMEPLLTQIEISGSRTDASLVADGFRCVEVPLKKKNGFLRKPTFLWLKFERAAARDVAADVVLEVALTHGHKKNLHSSLWSPPCHGFKRVAHNFGTAREDCFLWYRKRDTTYGREGLLHRSLAGLAAHASLLNVKGEAALVSAAAEHQQPYLQALERRVRQLCRDAVARQTDFDPETVLPRKLRDIKRMRNRKLDQPVVETVSKKKFIRALDRLGVQLRAKDIALIFDRLDTAGKGKVNREDVLDFFELTDVELEGVLRQMRTFLRHARRDKHQSVEALFYRLAGHEGDLVYGSDGKFISVAAFQRVLRRMKVVASQGEIQRLVDAVDRDGNGMIDLLELFAFLRYGAGAKRHLGARQKLLPSRIRSAAAVLHELCRKKASKGASSGRLSHELNIPYAWDRLVTSRRASDKVPDVLDVTRLRAMLRTRGVRLRGSEAHELLHAIDTKVEAQGGVGYAAFELFVLHHEVLPSEAQPEKEEPRRRRALRGFERALREFHADLNAMAANQGSDAGAVFAALFGRAATHVSVGAFKRMMDKTGSAVGFCEPGDLDRLIALIDRDADGAVSKREMTKFIESELHFEADDEGNGHSSSDEDTVDTEEERPEVDDDDGDDPWGDGAQRRRLRLEQRKRASPKAWAVSLLSPASFLSPRALFGKSQEAFGGGSGGASPTFGSGRSRQGSPGSPGSPTRGRERLRAARRGDGPISRTFALSPRDEWDGLDASGSPRFLSRRATSPVEDFLLRRRSAHSGAGISGAAPIWWLRPEPGEEDAPVLAVPVSPGAQRESALVARLAAGDLRKAWKQELDVDPAEPFEGPPLAGINVGELLAAAEGAVRHLNAPLGLRARFLKHDRDGQGFCSKKAFLRVLDRVGLTLPPAEHAALSKALLARDGGNGKVDYKLFCDVVAGSSEIAPTDLSRVHHRLREQLKGADYLFVMQGYDAKGDGTVCASDFKQALRLCDVHIAPHDWNALRPWIEREGGRLSYQTLHELVGKKPHAGSLKPAPLLDKDGKPVAAPQLQPADPNVLKKAERDLFDALSKREATAPDTSVADEIQAELEACDPRGRGYCHQEDFVRVLAKRVPKFDRLGIVAQRYATERGRIDYAAFAQACAARSGHAREDAEVLAALARALQGKSLTAACERRDPTGSGFLSRYEFRTVLANDLAVRCIGAEDLLNLMDLCDTQNDNFVDYLHLANTLAALPLEPPAPHKDKPRPRMCLDLRHAFKAHSKACGGSGDLVPSAQVQALLHEAGAPSSRWQDDGRPLTLERFLRLADVDEESWDYIVERLAKRFIKLEGEGTYFSHECDALADAPGVITRQQFSSLAAELHLPLSELDTDMLMRRFADDKHRLRYTDLLLFVRYRDRVRNVANLVL